MQDVLLRKLFVKKSFRMIKVFTNARDISVELSVPGSFFAFLAMIMRSRRYECFQGFGLGHAPGLHPFHLFRLYVENKRDGKQCFCCLE
jgi:hypothetical protein